MKILVLGGSGMLGSMCVDYLSTHGFEVTATARGSLLGDMRRNFPAVAWQPFDVLLDDVTDVIDESQWVINAIGIVKARCTTPAGVREAIRVNALFPWDVATAAAARGARVLQIATDCVYSGVSGGYTESSKHDPLDEYGKSKSLGECNVDSIFHMRASIVGPEFGGTSLLGWFLSQSQGAQVPGFTNHLWNGVTTLQFARVAAGIMTSGVTLPRMFHLVPGNSLSKAALLQLFQQSFRPDVTVMPVAPGCAVDRTLATELPEVNAAVWQAAGYAAPPLMTEMVAEMHDYSGTFRIRLG